MQQKRRAQPVGCARFLRALPPEEKGGPPFSRGKRAAQSRPPALGRMCRLPSARRKAAAPASSRAPLGPKGLPGPGALGRPLARWWQMWYDKRQKGAAQCLCRSKKGGARRNAAPAENRGLLYGTI